MKFRIFSGALAVALVLVYVAPPVLKLKELALAAVVAVGVVLMAMDLWQTLRGKDE